LLTAVNCQSTVDTNFSVEKETHNGDSYRVAAAAAAEAAAAAAIIPVNH